METYTINTGAANGFITSIEFIPSINTGLRKPSPWVLRLGDFVRIKRLQDEYFVRGIYLSDRTPGAQATVTFEAHTTHHSDQMKNKDSGQRPISDIREIFDRGAALVKRPITLADVAKGNHVILHDQMPHFHLGEKI
tara:strand:+ start:753 stop:1163 length:411 start_codon:yes stop_codon:yes gene_type:complete